MNDRPDRPEAAFDPPSPPEPPRLELESPDRVGMGGVAEEEASEAEPRRGLGRKGIVLFVALGVAGIGAGVFWGVHEISRRGYVDRLQQSYEGVSLLPSPGILPQDPDLQLQLYFIVNDQVLEPVSRRLRNVSGEWERAILVAHELQKPPLADLFESPLRPEVAIRGLYLLNGIVWLDLSKEFLEAGEPSPTVARLTIYGIVNSFLLNDPSLKGVRLLVDGQAVTTAWGWLDLSTPLGADLSLIH